MANVNSLTIGNTSLPVANSLASLSDVSASSPAAGQVLTCGDNGVWTPQSFQAAGFPGLDALNWIDTQTIMTESLTNPPVSNWPKIAKFQNVVFCRFGDDVNYTMLKQLLTTTLTSSFRLPYGYFNPMYPQAFMLDSVVAGKIETAGAIWLSKIISSTAVTGVRGLVHWYV